MFLFFGNAFTCVMDFFKKKKLEHGPQNSEYVESISDHALFWEMLANMKMLKEFCLHFYSCYPGYFEMVIDCNKGLAGYLGFSILSNIPFSSECQNFRYRFVFNSYWTMSRDNIIFIITYVQLFGHKVDVTYRLMKT